MNVTGRLHGMSAQQLRCDAARATTHPSGMIAVPTPADTSAMATASPAGRAGSHTLDNVPNFRKLSHRAGSTTTKIPATCATPERCNSMQSQFVSTGPARSCIVTPRMGVAGYATRDVASEATQTASYDIDREAARPSPARVGRYEICEVLGAGAMGVVYRARDPELDRAVAIKLVRGNSTSSSSGLRLLREAQAMARLRHPNVVPIFDVGPADSAVFVAMPLLEGGTLRSWLDDRSRSFDAILDRFVAAGRGLAAAHATGLVHRDFKPDNVLLGADGEVHVGDFGLARLVDDDLTPNPNGT